MKSSTKNSQQKLVSIGLLGANGRMGRTLQGLLTSTYASRAEHKASGGRSGGFDPLLSCDAIIDFSSPEALVQLCQQKQPLPPIITGSTGFTEEQWKIVEDTATKNTILFSANFSIGVYFLKNILRTASANLARAGYHPVMVETHHVHKLDAPSGTAKALSEAISPMRPESIEIHSVRAGEVIGDHEVTFYGPADKITISHSAQDRSIFARGAIDVALWLAGPQKATISTGRVLGLDDYFNERYGKS